LSKSVKRRHHDTPGWGADGWDDIDGVSDGSTDGLALGLELGISDALGVTDGAADGLELGMSDELGLSDGSSIDGVALGLLEGDALGVSDGAVESVDCIGIDDGGMEESSCCGDGIDDGTSDSFPLPFPSFGFLGIFGIFGFFSFFFLDETDGAADGDDELLGNDGSILGMVGTDDGTSDSFPFPFPLPLPFFLLLLLAGTELGDSEGALERSARWKTPAPPPSPTIG